MRRFLPVVLLCLAGVTATPASQPDQPRWHGIWMDGFNVFQIATGPGETVQVVGAAYRQIAARSYLDAQDAFIATPMGATMNLSSASGCVIDLSYADQGITAKDNGKCASSDVSFNGTYSRQ
jgi:hypothetical protein